MNPRRIVIDGKSYNSVDEMPEDVRKKYEQAMSSLKDQNGNRVPDAFENNNMLADNNRNGIPDIIENTPGAPIVKSSIKILMNGKEFYSLDDLPPEARANYEKGNERAGHQSQRHPRFCRGDNGRKYTTNATNSDSCFHEHWN